MASDLEFKDDGNETMEEELMNGFSVHFDIYPVIVAVLIVIANATALILILRRKKLQTVSNGISASLAVSDFLAGAVGIPLYLACNVTHTPSWCLSSAAFWRFVSVSTVLHLTILTLHLFATVVHALRYDSLSRQRVSVCLVCACWVCAAFVSLIQLSWIIYPDDNYYEHKLRVHRIYSIVVMILFLAVPLVTMVYCYTRIFALVRLYRVEKQAQLRKVRSLDDNQNQTFPNVALKWKVAVVFASMLAVFLICWTPYFILELMEDGETLESLPFWAVYFMFYYTRFTASAINPVILVLGKRDFRYALYECLRCCLTSKKNKRARGTIDFLV